MNTKRKAWFHQLEKLRTRTNNTCLVCFKTIPSYSFDELINENVCLCSTCLKELNPHLIKLKINNARGYGLYPYEGKVQELLFQYKGCYDIALKDVFFSKYRFLIKIRFHSFIIIPVPSYADSNKERGFNHVEEMVKSWNIKVSYCIKKIRDVKQSSLHYNERLKANENFMFESDGVDLKNKNILIVDDVLTTGSTLNACIELIKKQNPKKIMFLVMSYTSREKGKFGEHF